MWCMIAQVRDATRSNLSPWYRSAANQVRPDNLSITKRRINGSSTRTPFTTIRRLRMSSRRIWHHTYHQLRSAMLSSSVDMQQRTFVPRKTTLTDNLRSWKTTAFQRLRLTRTHAVAKRSQLGTLLCSTTLHSNDPIHNHRCPKRLYDPLLARPYPLKTPSCTCAIPWPGWRPSTVIPTITHRPCKLRTLPFNKAIQRCLNNLYHIVLCCPPTAHPFLPFRMFNSIQGYLHIKQCNHSASRIPHHRRLFTHP